MQTTQNNQTTNLTQQTQPNQVLDVQRGNHLLLSQFASFLQSFELIDKEGKERLDYMIEIGDSKGDFPPTPHGVGETQDYSMLQADIPEDAINFAAKTFKEFLLSISEQEADQLAKSLVLKWEFEYRRINDLYIAKLEEQFNLNDESSPFQSKNQNNSNSNKTRRRRQERLTEINHKIKQMNSQKSFSPDNSILANIRQLDQQYQELKKPFLKKSGSPNRAGSPQSNGKEQEDKFNQNAKQQRNRNYTDYQQNSQLKYYMAQTANNNPLLTKELSSIMDDGSALFNQNSFLSKNHTQVLVGLAQQLDGKDKNVQCFYEKLQHGPLGRYASKEMIDKNYDSIGSGHNSPERFTEYKSTDKLKSASSLQDLTWDARKTNNGQAKINMREFREKMIQNGFKKPAFFVRVDQGSPKPVSKLHERLYQDKHEMDKKIEEKKKKKQEEELKECTFAPQVNNNLKYLKRKGARSPNPIEMRRNQEPLIITEESTGVQMTTQNDLSALQQQQQRTREAKPTKTSPMNSGRRVTQKQAASGGTAASQQEAFDRLYYESKRMKEEKEKKNQEIKEQEIKNLTFQPNRENTKKADKKFGLNNRSPERFNRYYQEFVDRSKKVNEKQPQQPQINQQQQKQNYATSQSNHAQEHPQQNKTVSQVLHKGSLLQNANSRQQAVIQTQSKQETLTFTENSQENEQIVANHNPQSDFEKRNADFIKKKEEKLKTLAQQLEQTNTFMPKLFKKRRSVDSRVQNKDQDKASACDRLYEQGRTLIILKEEFIKIQQEEEAQNSGRPEINEKTNKILELKQKRTGESYVSPMGRQASGSGSRMNNSSSNASQALLSYRAGSGGRQTDRCPFSVNESMSEYNSKCNELKGKNGEGYNALDDILHLKDEDEYMQFDTEGDVKKNKDIMVDIKIQNASSARLSARKMK